MPLLSESVLGHGHDKAGRGFHHLGRLPFHHGDRAGQSDKELPRRSMTSKWTELSYFQKQSSKIAQFRDLRQNPFSAFVLGAVLVFFVLAGTRFTFSTH